MTFEEVRKMIIISLFADDDLYERFVLKGGNALLVHNINARASMDIDVSMNNKFDEEEIEWVKETLENNLNETFKRKNHAVIDVKLDKKPRNMPEEKEKFWGGYCLEFKIVSMENKEKLEKKEIQINELRQLAIIADGAASKKFKVDISNYEFCKGKVEVEIEGFPIYVYTPIVIVYEKLRAICQQQKEYKKFVETNCRPRPRDFFDIYTIVEEHGQHSNIKEGIYQEKNLKDLVEIFSLKRVPLDFLRNIKDYREFHHEEFASVEATINHSTVKVETFDFYFDYSLKIVNRLLEELTNLDMMDNTCAIA